MAQLEADEHGLFTTLLDVAGHGFGEGAGEHYDNDGNVCRESWYRLRTHLGRLDEPSVVHNSALIGDCSLGHGRVQAK